MCIIYHFTNVDFLIGIPNDGINDYVNFVQLLNAKFVISVLMIEYIFIAIINIQIINKMQSMFKIMIRFFYTNLKIIYDGMKF